MCIAVIMVLTGIRVGPAAALILGSRRGACPNASFQAQLLVLDALLHNEQSSLTGFQGGDAAAVARAMHTWRAAHPLLPYHCRSPPWLVEDHSTLDVPLFMKNVTGYIDRIAVIQREAESLLAARMTAGDNIYATVPQVCKLLAPQANIRRQRYCCGRCNAIIFYDTNLTACHSSMLCDAARVLRGADGCADACSKTVTALRCSIISIEPGLCFFAQGVTEPGSMNPTMLPEEGTLPSSVVSGHMVCQQCWSKVGGWNWAGVHCACGARLRPAFFAIASRIVVRCSQAHVVTPAGDTGTCIEGPVGDVLSN